MREYSDEKEKLRVAQTINNLFQQQGVSVDSKKGVSKSITIKTLKEDAEIFEVHALFPLKQINAESCFLLFYDVTNENAFKRA